MVTRTRTHRRLLGVLLVSALAPSLAVVTLACGTDDGGSRDIGVESQNVASADAPDLRQHEVGYVFIDIGAWDDTNLQWPSIRYPAFPAVTNLADELTIMGRSPSEVVDVPPITASSIEGLASAEFLRELGRTSDPVSTAVYPVIANVDDELTIMGLRSGDLVSARFPVSSIEGFASAELLLELGRTN